MSVELNRLIDALPGLVWTALPDGRAEFVNQRWRDYTGLSTEQAFGHGWLSAIHPEEVHLVLSSWRAFLDSGRAGEVQARLRRHDGQYRRFLFRAAPIVESGRTVQWCGVNIDIEERLRAIEDAKAASEAELKQAHRFLVDAERLSLTGSYVANLAADDHLWSEEAYRIFELEPKTRISMNVIRDMLHPEDRRSFEDVFKQALIDGIGPDHYFRIITPSGKVKHLHSVGYKTENSADQSLIVGAIQDVTERKLAEVTLKSREAELESMLRHLTEAQRLSKTGSFQADILNDAHVWSEECYRLCEIAPGSEIKTQTILDLLHPDDVSTFQEAVAQALTGVAAFTYRIVTPRGAVKHLRGVAHRMDSGPSEATIMGAIQDVTEGKLAEDALNQARTELAHVARVMTMGALTASIAHEVNQPLFGIITNADTCLRMLSANPPNIEGACTQTQRIMRDGNRASQVIQRLRTMFARKQPIMESVDLNDAAREVLALSLSQVQRCQAVIRTDFADELPTARGDRVQLQQVVLNLILNAADAMMEIEDRPREMLLSTTASEGGKEVRLSVCDSGVGINPQQIQKLFETFYTTKSNGMGVGLSISRSIIESHGGRLWASPNDGPGATFSFSIPCETGEMQDLDCAATAL